MPCAWLQQGQYKLVRLEDGAFDDALFFCIARQESTLIGENPDRQPGTGWADMPVRPAGYSRPEMLVNADFPVKRYKDEQNLTGFLSGFYSSE